MLPVGKKVKRSSRIVLIAGISTLALAACALNNKPLDSKPNAVQDDLADYSGTWQISADSASFRAHPLCIFQQAGSRITGTCKGGSNIGTGEGTADGNNFKFMWQGTAYIPGGECVCMFTGKRISATQITGTVETMGVTTQFVAVKQYVTVIINSSH